MSSSGKVNVSSHGMSSLFELFKELGVYREQLRAAQWKWFLGGGGTQVPNGYPLPNGRAVNANI